MNDAYTTKPSHYLNLSPVETLRGESRAIIKSALARQTELAVAMTEQALANPDLVVDLDAPADDNCIMLRPLKPDPRHCETVQMSVEKADALIDREMLAKAADLKHRIALNGKLDDAAVLSFLIKRVTGML